MLRGGRGAPDRYHWRVWGALSAPLGLHPVTGVCFPCVHCSGSRLLYREWPWVACGSSFPSSTKAQALLGLRSVPSPARAAQAARSLTGTLSPGVVRLLPSTVPASVSTCAGRVHLVSVLGSWSLSVTLLADVNHPESQEVFGYKLGACLQFGRGCRLWGRVCAFPLLPASRLWRGLAGPPPASSSLEVLSLSFVLWMAGRQCVPLALLPVNFLSLSLSIPQFKLLSQVSSLRLPSGHPGLVLTLSNAARSSPFSPHLLVVDASVRGAFLLGVAFRHVICGFYLFFLPVRLPSEIQKLPPDPPVRGFPGVWKLSLLRLPSRDGYPSLGLLSLFLSFIFCPTSFQRWWAAFLGAWCPLLAMRSCFVQFAQRSNVLSMNL